MNKQDYINLGREHRVSGHLMPLTEPKSWQEHAYAEGYNEMPTVAAISELPASATFPEAIGMSLPFPVSEHVSCLIQQATLHPNKADRLYRKVEKLGAKWSKKP